MLFLLPILAAVALSAVFLVILYFGPFRRQKKVTMRKHRRPRYMVRTVRKLRLNQTKMELVGVKRTFLGIYVTLLIVRALSLSWPSNAALLW